MTTPVGTSQSHLILVGLPGSGKSTVGPLLAEALRSQFVDLDREIERRERMSVSDVFSTRGEEAFRAMEHAMTRDLAGKQPMVIAPGGGWMLDERNVSLLRPPGRILHLLVSVQTAVQRLGPDISRRPLLAGPAASTRLAALAVARMPLYSMADAEIDTESLTPQEVTDFAVRLASAWGWPIG